MDSGRRQFLGRWGAVVTGVAAPFAFSRPVFQESHARPDLGAGANTATDLQTDSGAGTSHERFMRLAIEQAQRNPMWPFGAVIVDTRTGDVRGSGVNAGADNPVLHGEVVAMNDYVGRHGNRGWADTTLYTTTGEPCSMCMSAMAWADLRRVVRGSSIDEIRRTGIQQIALTAREVAASARSFYTPELLLGDVLADRTNRLFQEAERLRQRLPDTPSANTS
ncbi:nucleoside deaminase [Streptomyces acidicola]|uniref:nucleoside deaminase n=1 Tax=Streptomyces acidicola TaxID=2596892 RepID=UPI0037B6E453